MINQLVDDLTAEVEALVRKHRDSCSNEVLAVLASDAFQDGCDAWEIPKSRDLFNARFPGLALYL